MSVTVCLCTFDGARYLPVLLDSLVAQTCPVDELLVGDDGSSDETLEILEQFRRRAPFAVELVVGPGHLGHVSNLERLLARATGDVVLPCDQDDIWAPTKIEQLAAALARSGRAGAAVCNSSLIDAAGNPLPGSLFEQVRLDGSTVRAMESGEAVLQIADRNVVASHALALRHSALDLVLPFGAPGYADWWIALVLSGTTGIAVVEECLVAYRLHGANVAGLTEHARLIERRSLAASARITRRADLLEAAMGRIDEIAPGSLAVHDRRLVEARISHLRVRESLPASRLRRSPVILAEAASGRYWRYGNGWRSAVIDLVRSSAPEAR